MRKAQGCFYPAQACHGPGQFFWDIPLSLQLDSIPTFERSSTNESRTVSSGG